MAAFFACTRNRLSNLALFESISLLNTGRGGELGALSTSSPDSKVTRSREKPGFWPPLGLNNYFMGAKPLLFGFNILAHKFKTPNK